MKKELNVKAIKEGTVIDHIPSRLVFRVLRILNPQEYENMLLVATNLPSKRIGKKGLIKVSNKNLSKEEVNKIALIAPQATMNIIKNYEVKEKYKVEVPEKIENLVKCSNPHCITNHENVSTKFSVVSKNPVKINCFYCERDMPEQEIMKNVLYSFS